MTRPLRAVAVAVVFLLIGQAAWRSSPAGASTRRRSALRSHQAAGSRQAVGPLSALLVDVRTGRLLFQRDIHRRLEPASTTKMLTAILVLESLPLDKVVTITPRAAAERKGTVVGLEAGEEWTVRDLLYAMLVHSANDAAVALAEAVGGSIPRFADLMNARARQVGARESHFVNPTGMHDPAHYSTAYDLAVIARYALQYPAFATIVRTQTWTLERPDRLPETFVNTNKLLGWYEGADGVKFGWTPAAGYALVATATRNDWQLLSVVLKSQAPLHDSQQLLDYGFKTFATVVVAPRGKVLATMSMGRQARLVAVVPADIRAVVRRGGAVTPRVTLRSDLRPPVPAGAAVGSVRFVEAGAIVAESVLVADRPVGR